MSSDARQLADRKAIAELHQRDIAATKAYDIEALVSLMSDDIVALPPSGKPTRGRETARKGLEAGRPQMQEIEVIDYQQNWEEVHIAGDYAFEWGAFLSVFRPKGSDIVRERHNVLRVLKRSADGTWRVHRTIWNNAPQTE